MLRYTGSTSHTLIAQIFLLWYQLHLALSVVSGCLEHSLFQLPHSATVHPLYIVCCEALLDSYDVQWKLKFTEGRMWVFVKHRKVTLMNVCGGPNDSPEQMYC